MQYKKFIIHVYMNLQNFMETGKGGEGKPLFDKHYLPAIAICNYLWNICYMKKYSNYIDIIPLIFFRVTSQATCIALNEKAHFKMWAHEQAACGYKRKWTGFDL